MFLHYMKQSACLSEISFTCFKTGNAVTAGIRFCGKTPAIFDLQLYRIFSETTRGILSKPSMYRCIRPKMISFCQKQSRELLITQHCNNLLVASPPRPLVGFFKTCPRCSACSLVVYARKKFRSVRPHLNTLPRKMYR